MATSGLGYENHIVWPFLLFQAQMDLENSHLTLYGLQGVFKADFLTRFF